MKVHQHPQSDGGRNTCYTARSSQVKTTWYRDARLAQREGSTLWLTNSNDYGPHWTAQDEPPTETPWESLGEIQEILRKDRGPEETWLIDWPWWIESDPEDITIFAIESSSDRWYTEIKTTL